MAIAIQWLVRNFELRAIIARIVQIAGKASVLEVLADIKYKKSRKIIRSLLHPCNKQDGIET